MSCCERAKTWGILPVVRIMTSMRSGETGRMQPRSTVGEMANPLQLMIRFPLVVSMEMMASMRSSTSMRFICCMSMGEPMNGTGSCGSVGASGQTCVPMTTSPSRTSPRRCMSESLSATVSAASAPSPSDTAPIISGRAPSPPSLPTTPSVGASPPADLPLRPGMRTFTQSVPPRSPSTRVEVASAAPRDRSTSHTSWPLAWGLSIRS